MSDKVVNIIFILDESGSMGRIAEEAVSGYNKFIEEQKKLDGVAEVSLFTFSNAVKCVKDREPLQVSSDLVACDQYYPGGMTALYDAIGTVISKFKNEKKNTVMCILTDGEENSSKEYSYDQVKKLLSEVQDELNWDVTFLGANIKEMEKFTSSIGIKAGKSIAFEASAEGITRAYATMNICASTARNAFAVNG